MNKMRDGFYKSSAPELTNMVEKYLNKIVNLQTILRKK